MHRLSSVATLTIEIISSRLSVADPIKMFRMPDAELMASASGRQFIALSARNTDDERWCL
jgi:hypothetical protein